MAHLTNWACKYMLRKIIVVVHCLESEILHKVRVQPLCKFVGLNVSIYSSILYKKEVYSVASNSPTYVCVNNLIGRIDFLAGEGFSFEKYATKVWLGLYLHQNVFIFSYHE